MRGDNSWLAWARRLEAIASTGSHYAADEFDRERYGEVAAIARAMLSSLSGAPVARIENLLSDFATGHKTPKIDVRGAVIEHGKILLVQEKSDGRWALPGGFAEVGKSAAENVAKEIHEEAGLRVNVTRLYGVRHKAKQDYEPDIRDFYKLFFLCQRDGASAFAPGPEVKAADFFAPDRLPPLSRSRVLESDIIAAFGSYRNPSRPTMFD